jgi:hypothetical protein
MITAPYYKNTNLYFAGRLEVTSLLVAFFSSLSPVISIATPSAFKAEVLNNEILLWWVPTQAAVAKAAFKTSIFWCQSVLFFVVLRLQKRELLQKFSTDNCSQVCKNLYR